VVVIDVCVCTGTTINHKNLLDYFLTISLCLFTFHLESVGICCASGKKSSPLDHKGYEPNALKGLGLPHGKG
jgi:hypothetical protein